MDVSGKIVQKMYEKDAFSQWLGINRVLVEKGSCILSMIVREEMCNGFDIAHGGITYSLADSALAFASNSHGLHALSIETTISHTKPVYAGDRLTATANEENLSRKIGIYRIEVINQKKEKVAIFKGIVYRTDKNWEVD